VRSVAGRTRKDQSGWDDFGVRRCGERIARGGKEQRTSRGAARRAVSMERNAQNVGAGRHGGGGVNGRMSVGFRPSSMGSGGNAGLMRRNQPNRRRLSAKMLNLLPFAASGSNANNNSNNNNDRRPGRGGIRASLPAFLVSPTAQHKDKKKKSTKEQDDEEEEESKWQEEEEEEDESLPVDPVLLTRIEPNEVTFTFVRPNGSKVIYRVSSLIDYMIYTGNFHEPETAIEFSQEDLRELDRLAHKAKMGKRSVCLAKAQPEQYVPRRFSESALVGLERCCGELVGEVPDIIEKSESRDRAQSTLYNEVFPEIRHYYEQIKEVDREFAKQSAQSWINFIRGPPNRPVKDKHGLIPLCIKFLKELAGIK